MGFGRYIEICHIEKERRRKVGSINQGVLSCLCAKGYFEFELAWGIVRFFFFFFFSSLGGGNWDVFVLYVSNK